MFEIFGAASAIIGAIVGAGFITGAEIVSFFSGGNLPVSCAVLCALLFASTLVLLLAGRRWQTQKMANLCVLGGFCKIAEMAVYVFSFITLSGMCAGLDAVFARALKIDARLPVASPIALALSFAVCRRGVEGIERLSIFLVPTMIAVMLVACLSGARVCPPAQGLRPWKIVLYVGMNAFLSSPVTVGAGKRLSAGGAVVVSAVVAVCVSACVYLIMSKIATGYGTDENLPLLSAISCGRIFSLVFVAVTAIGIFTTLLSSHYPLVCAVDKNPLKRRLNAYMCIGALALSRIGFYNIVAYLYPVIGAIGAVYLCLFALHPLIGRADEPFKKAYQRVHTRGERTQHQR